MQPFKQHRAGRGAQLRAVRRTSLVLALGAIGWGSFAHAADASAESTSTSGKDAFNPTLAIDFNSDFLQGQAVNKIDVSKFALGNPIQPWIYRVEAFLNERWLGRLDIELATNPASKRVETCIDRALALRLSLDPAKVPQKVRDFLMAKPSSESGASASIKCVWVSDIADAARATFDPSELRLDLAIPQALTTRVARGYVPPESWDAGVRAASLEYQFSTYRTSTKDAGGGVGASNTSNFLGLTARANLGGGWQLTHIGNEAWSSGAGGHYTSLATYARHDVPSLLSSFSIGDSYTDGQLFDAVNFRGVQLATDQRMLPDSQRGYAPVIRGQARGNATVSVKQNGTLLTEVVVPPGPFEINDLYPPGFGGDLVVTVTEADGSQQSFNVAYSSGPQLLREGQLFYSLSSGDLNIAGLSNRPFFGQGTVQYGLSNAVTLNGGVIAMSRYQALLAGGAFNTPAGAFGLNITTSRFSPLTGSTLTGNSYNGTYSVVVPTVKTNVTFAAYRYNSANYYSQRDAASELAGDPYALGYKAKNRAVLSVYQNLTERSSFQASTIFQRYWNRIGSDRDYQISYSHRIGVAQLTLGWSKSAIADMAPASNRVTVGLNIPIGVGAQSVNVAGNYSHDKTSGSTEQLTASGAFGENSAGSYGVSAIKTSTSSQATVAANAGWRSGIGTLGATASTSQASSQVSLSMSGGIVAHAGGVTLAPAVGETFAIVDAGEAVGAEILNGYNLKVDRSGYAIVPYLIPYQTNPIDLDMKKVSLNVELESTSAQVAPHAGSAVEIKLSKGRSGLPALFELSLAGGGPIPLGASVLDEQGQTVGVVGQGGVAEVRVASERGRLNVSWGEDRAKSCVFDYALEPRNGKDMYSRGEAVCQPPSANAPAKSTPPAISQAAPDDSQIALELGRRKLVRTVVQTAKGKEVPRGADVVDEQGRSYSSVGASGRVAAWVPAATQYLVVSWGDSALERCAIPVAGVSAKGLPTCKVLPDGREVAMR